MKRLYTLFSGLILFLPLVLQGQNSVTSMSLGGGNGQSGVTFNVGSSQNINIDSIGIALYGTATQTLEVWYNTSPINGAPTINATNGWVLYTTVTISGISGSTVNPTQYIIPLSTPLNIPAGQTYGLYVGGSGTSVVYTTWSSANQDVFTDGTVTLSTGQNIGYGGVAPSPTFHPRQFNGTIYYSNAVFTPWDAGATFIDPAVVCTGNNSLFAGFKNYGDSVITSLTVNWSVDGILQTPVSYTGFLDSAGGTGVKEDTVLLGIWNFTGMVHTFKVWTSNLNGNADTVNFNDTLTMLMGPSLSGNYTIGGIGADYPNFTAAAADLQLRGVCGAVNFDVANGVYNEQISLNAIAGSSSTNTITFKSVSNDSTAVKITAAGTSTNNYVIQLDDADHVTIKGITVENTSPSYSNAIRVINGSENATVTNCILTSPIVSSTSNFTAVVYATGLNHGGTLAHNVINGGGYSVYWYGVSTTSRVEDFTAEHNDVSGQYYRGIYVYYSTNTALRNNKVFTSTPYSSGYMAAAVYYVNGGYEITGNRLIVDNTGSYSYPLYLYYGEAPNNNRGLVANNFIAAGNPSVTSYHYGTYIYNSTNFDYVHNSTNLMSSSSSASYGLYSSGGGGMRYLNNNFVNMTNGGYGIYITGSYILECDHNNLYAPGGTGVGYLGGAFTTLNDWQNNTGFDLNSVSTDPNYKTDTELYPCNDTLDAKGTPVGVAYDIDGELRNPITPDIGADEFVAGNPNLGPDTTVCSGTSITLSTYGPSNSTFTWNTAATTPSITVNFPGIYVVNSMSFCGIPGQDSIVVTHLDPPFADFTSNNSFLTAQFVNNTQNGVTYHWDFGDGNTSSDSDPAHLFQQSGYHQITLIATNDCGSDTLTKWILLTVVGAEELGDEPGISVYPNPASEQAQVVLTGMSGKRVDIVVRDINGRLVYKTAELVNGPLHKTTLSPDQKFSTGMYFVEVIHAEGKLMGKLMVK